MSQSGGNAALFHVLGDVSDVALLLDPGGSVLDVRAGNRELSPFINQSWVGCDWVTSVGPDLEARARELLEAALHGSEVVRADLSHPLKDGSSLPLHYRLLTEPGGNVVALARDLRPVANLRQQLVNAQQALEQDYWRLRQVETRYRQVFELVSEAILVCDAATGRVLEANAAATELLGRGGVAVVGQSLPLGLEGQAAAALNDLLAEAQVVGRAGLEALLVPGAEVPCAVLVSYLRQGSETRYLLRFSPESRAGDEREASLPMVLRRSPDGFLLTDRDGRVVSANLAFLDLAQVASEDRVVGQSADRWVGRSGVDLQVLLSNLRDRDQVRLFGTVLRGDSGVLTEIEISAIRLDDLTRPLFAFFIRDISRRISASSEPADQLPATIEQITNRVGRVPLKELVRESTDIIEALCIRAALDLTRDNRASAAELLGLSRQSLYAKLRRYSIAGADPEAVASGG